MLNSLPNEILINILDYLAPDEIFDAEKAFKIEYRLNDFFWESRCPIPRLENCRLSFYDITKKFINKKECFNCDKPVDLEYIFLINHGYKDECYYLENYHKNCIKPFQKLSKKLGMYKSPISGENLMGIFSIGV